MNKCIQIIGDNCIINSSLKIDFKIMEINEKALTFFTTPWKLANPDHGDPLAEKVGFTVLAIFAILALGVILPLIICWTIKLLHEKVTPTAHNTPPTITFTPEIQKFKGTNLPKTFLTELRKGKALDESVGAGRIKKVVRPKGSAWVIKVWNQPLRPFTLPATDILFYQASKQLDLRVVPKIRYIACDSDNFCLIKKTYPNLSPILVQAYIEEKNLALANLNIPHAQDVVLFNWIMGRQDSKRENSAVDIDGKVWEIDNDSPGGLYSLKERNKSWLEEISPLMNHPLSKSTIEKLLNLPEKITLDQRFIPDYHNVHIRKIRIEKTLNENLSKLQAIIRNLIQHSTDAALTLKMIVEKIASE